ncbi:MAG TPA: glycosyltransferase [Pyrinomonadaceae bacterium]|jgi:glycosyltransferase involved in cell wall biosynthesis
MTNSVSVCIPTFNGARWILDSINSALSQTFPPSEILVVDDGSTDDTVEIVRAVRDERIRLVLNERNLGLARNWNRCVELARGQFVKFLFQDDILYPQCIERMVQLFLSAENLGLVFAARDIIIDVEDEITREWLENCATLHTRFRALECVNRGRDLFAQYLEKEFLGNWVGEPSSVMIRRECFDRVGLFNTAMYQTCDVEMWLRIMFFYDVGFIQEKLSAFRYHADSTTRANMKSRRDWLDQVRLLEGLLSYDEIRAAYPEIKRIRRLQIMRTIGRLIVPLKLRRSILRSARRVLVSSSLH